MILRRPEHHTPAMGASLLDAAGEPGRKLQKESVPLRVLQRMAVHGRLRERLFPAGEAGVDPVAVMEAGGDLAAEGVDLLRRVPERPRRHPHGSPQRHRLYRRSLGYASTPVAMDHLEAHLVPSYGAEVQINIGRVLASLVQKALEEQPVREGLGLTQPQTVRDQAVRGAPSTRNGDTLRLRDLFGFVRDQEVRREPQSVDAAQLSPESRFQLLCRRTILRSSPVASPGARERQLQ